MNNAVEITMKSFTLRLCVAVGVGVVLHALLTQRPTQAYECEGRCDDKHDIGPYTLATSEEIHDCSSYDSG